MSAEKLREVLDNVEENKTPPQDIVMQVLRDAEDIAQRLNGIAGYLQCLYTVIEANLFAVDQKKRDENIMDILSISIRDIKTAADIAGTASARAVTVTEQLRCLGYNITPAVLRGE